MQDNFDKIYEANTKRSNDNFQKRLGKLAEEYGEVWNAFLGITSKNNPENKTWDDVREELIDCLIIVIDLLYTELPDKKWTKKEIEIEMRKLFELKLSKWKRQLTNKEDITLD